MRVGRRRHLRQMRDAQNLPLGRDLLHLLADDVSGFAADIGVHFIKHQHGNFVFRGEHRFERKHHTRHFAGRRDGAQRFGRLAGIGRKLKFDDVESGRRRRGKLGVGGRRIQLPISGFQLLRDVKFTLFEPQIFQLFADGFGQRRNNFFARGGKFFAGGNYFRIQFFQRGVEAGQFGVAAFERG